jgi:spore germination cell wall hydrolase CwlJ-like protein
LKILLVFVSIFSVTACAEYEVASADEQCMVENVYHEARGESKAGQLAVMHVVMNRIRSVDYPNTICKVVWQNRQFSWTQDGKSDIMKNHVLRWRTKLLVLDFFDKWKDFDNSYGATMYHASRITPFWADSYDKTIQIDNHIFYKKR